MSDTRGQPGSGPNRGPDAAEGPPSGGSPTATQVFELLWSTLSDLLGSATTATLLRRSQKALALRNPEISKVIIARDGLEYRFTLPADWTTFSHETLATVNGLVDELRPILKELTGLVVLRRLDGVSAFGRSGIVFARGAE